MAKLIIDEDRIILRDTDLRQAAEIAIDADRIEGFKFNLLNAYRYLAYAEHLTDQPSASFDFASHRLTIQDHGLSIWVHITKTGNVMNDGSDSREVAKAHWASLTAFANDVISGITATLDHPIKSSQLPAIENYLALQAMSAARLESAGRQSIMRAALEDGRD